VKKRNRKNKSVEPKEKEKEKILEKVQEEDEDKEYLPNENKSQSKKRKVDKEKVSNDSEHLTDAFMSNGSENAEMRRQSLPSVEFEEDREGSQLRQGEQLDAYDSKDVTELTQNELE